MGKNTFGSSDGYWMHEVGKKEAAQTNQDPLTFSLIKRAQCIMHASKIK